MPRSKDQLPMKQNEKGVRKERALLSNVKRGMDQVGEASFRVYYGQNGAAVPFVWESQPGTPKHPSSKQSNDQIVPPLTPPPSYHSSSSFSSTSFRNTRGSRILSSFFSSIARRGRSPITPSPMSISSSVYSDPHSWSISSSSTDSVSLSSFDCSGRKKHNTHRRSLSLCLTPRVNKFPLFYDDGYKEDKDMHESPTNADMKCFRFKKQGCYTIKDSKNTTLFNKEH